MSVESVRVQVNGIGLRVLRQGSGDPLVLLHGFTGSADSWLPIAGGLGRDYRVHAIDLIGQGGSAVPVDGTRYAFERAVDDLVAALTALGIDRAAWLGYSLGGRLALGVALAHPERVSALILESATAGIQDEDERASRRISDESLADRIERHGIEAFVAEWEALPMWASQQTLAAEVLAAQRAQRLANDPVGLANILRGMGQGAQQSLWDRLGDVRAPTLLIAGALDAKFAGIAAEMHQTIPHAALTLVPLAGHAVHLESPDRFCEIVLAFLARRHVAADAARQEVVR